MPRPHGEHDFSPSNAAGRTADSSADHHAPPPLLPERSLLANHYFIPHVLKILNVTRDTVVGLFRNADHQLADSVVGAIFDALQRGQQIDVRGLRDSYDFCREAATITSSLTYTLIEGFACITSHAAAIRDRRREDGVRPLPEIFLEKQRTGGIVLSIELNQLESLSWGAAQDFLSDYLPGLAVGNLGEAFEAKLPNDPKIGSDITVELVPDVRLTCLCKAFEFEDAPEYEGTLLDTGLDRARTSQDDIFKDLGPSSLQVKDISSEELSMILAHIFGPTGALISSSGLVDYARRVRKVEETIDTERLEKLARDFNAPITMEMQQHVHLARAKSGPPKKRSPATTEVRLSAQGIDGATYAIILRGRFRAQMEPVIVVNDPIDRSTPSLGIEFLGRAGESPSEACRRVWGMAEAISGILDSALDEESVKQYLKVYQDPAEELPEGYELEWGNRLAVVVSF